MMKIRWPWVSRARLVKMVQEADRAQEMCLAAQKGWREANQRVDDLLAQQPVVDPQSQIAGIVNRVRVSENELGGWLNVPDDHPVLKGVLEVLARNEDALVRDSLGEDLPVQARLDLSAGLRAVRNARLDVAHAVIEARRPKRTAN